MDSTLAPLPSTPVSAPATVPPASGEPLEAGTPPAAPKGLSRQQKAAVIVQFLLSEGASLPLGDLSEDAQEELTAQIGRMRLVDRDTLREVVHEFVSEMESIGLTFPGGIEGALGVLDGHISPATAARLRREAGIAAKGNPWERIAAQEPERLLQLLEEESTEIGAVLLSKLHVAKAATLLGMLPGQRARELSYAISRTGKILPETVRRIGVSLAGQLAAEPLPAFDDEPVKRIGEILNFSRTETRDDVLAGLEETDSDFAAEVRRAIFTFNDIPERISPRDVPRIIRAVEQAAMVTAFAYADGKPPLEAAREHLLGNMSKRMADALRDEVSEATAPERAVAEDAMNQILMAIRDLADNGDITLISTEAD